MMMGSFQGQSTKFDFSSHAQDSAVTLRKTKDEANKELSEMGEGSGSSLELDNDDLFDDAENDKISKSVNAFDVFSSISSNPPDRRMVFSNSLLREPSQRFDFHKGTNHSGTAFNLSQHEATICEEDEAEEESESEEETVPVKSMAEEVENDEWEKDQEDEETEQEQSKNQENCELDKDLTSIQVPGSSKNDSGESKEGMLDDNGLEREEHPFLSDCECLQLDFQGEFQVFIHALVKQNVPDERNSILLLSSKGVSLDRRLPQESVVKTNSATSNEDVAPQAAQFSRLVQALKDSKERTRHAQEAVRVLQQQIHKKRHHLGEIEKKRQRAMKKLSEENIILEK
jgi:hypothetical protein